MIHLMHFAVVLISIGLLGLWWQERVLAREARERAEQLAAQNEDHRLALDALLDVLERDAGGLTARIAEHGLLADAILKNAPGLLRVEPELSNWLNRHDRFWKALHAAAAPQR
jgi:hypothetical protein